MLAGSVCQAMAPGWLIAGHLNGSFWKVSGNIERTAFAVGFDVATLASGLSSARTRPGFLDFPPNAELTGTYSGVVQNLTAGLSADFKIVVSETTGAVEGCMTVKPPLVGSGYLRGTARGGQLSFVVVSDSAQLSFDGQRHADDLSGTYTVSDPAGGSEQQGTFSLHKTSQEGLSSGFNILNCPSDAAILGEAAERGNAFAQFALGVLYFQGSGVPQDYSQSYFWVKLAAAGKVEGVKQDDLAKILDTIATHLTTAALSQAQERVREWLATHPTKAQ